MTVSTTTSKVSYSGNGSTVAFAVNFYFLANSHLKVVLRAADGTETVQTLNTDYTVSGAGVSSGGTVTMTTAPASGKTLVIARNVPQTQLVDYQPNDPFPANTHEQALDQLTMEIQQLQEAINRAIKLSLTNTMTSTEFTVGATDRANKVLAFDANGELTVAQELGTYQGNWSSGKAYKVRDIIKDTSNSNIYICLVAHTSSGAQPISTNTDASKWALLVDAAAAASSASAAASSASSAATSATNAASSASSASSSASTATTQASNASTSASSASSSASSASTSATNAAASATAASASAASAAAAAASGLYRQVLDKTSNYTILTADQGTLFRSNTSGGAITFTLPSISAVTDGFKVSIVKWTSDANVVNINRAGSDTINGGTSVQIGSQYSQVVFVADFETNQWFASQTGLGATNNNVDVFSGNGSTTVFTLSADPGSKNNTRIHIGGVYQFKSTYSVSGTTLTFSSAPPAGSSNIEVEYGTPLAIGTPSDGTVSTAKIVDGAVTAAKLASGAAVSNIGYTPVNKAGDTMTGALNLPSSASTAVETLAIRFTDGTNQLGSIRAYNNGGYNQSMRFYTTNAAGSSEAKAFEVDGVGNFQMNSGYGSVATAYGCRAWASIVGSSGSVSAGGNISSVTRNASGNYSVNMTTAMPDANYAVCSIGSSGAGTNGNNIQMDTTRSKTTSQFSVLNQVNNVIQDPPANFYVAVFR